MKALARALIAGLSASLLATAGALPSATAPARTSIVVFGAAKMTAASRTIGYCWTNSIASRGSDAYRCMTGNEIHDPCFAIDARSVACPAYQNPASGVRVALTEPLPRAGAVSKRNAWMMRLAGGISCNVGTGTVILGYPFYCTGNLVCAAPESGSGSRPTFVRCGRPKSAIGVTHVSHYLVTVMYQ